MLRDLENALELLQYNLEVSTLWDSLIVNKRKPYTYRVFTVDGPLRVCLHKFDPCDTHEAFSHPHPWPAAFIILQGSYRMKLGYTHNRKHMYPYDVCNTILTKYSRYEILDPMTWHSVIPLETTYTVMVNGPAWDKDTVAHSAVRTTAGKDLDKMPPDELESHLDIFKRLVGDYLKCE